MLIIVTLYVQFEAAVDITCLGIGKAWLSFALCDANQHVYERASDQLWAFQGPYFIL